ncbi:Carbamate kinase 1 [compost metagenome]
MQAVKTTARAIVDLIEHGHQVVVTHGNGPQVGMINLAFEAAVAFAESKPGRQALITVLSKAQQGIEGKTGTVISH